MTKQEIMEAAKWQHERDDRLAEISRLQQEYRKFEATCKHWSSYRVDQEAGGYHTSHEVCEWCGQEVNP